MTLTSEANDDAPSAWYRTDPLTRLVISVGTVVAAVLLDGIVCLTALALLAVVLPAALARVARQVLATALLLALPLALSVVLVNVLFTAQGTVIATLGPFEITEEGVRLAISVVARVLAMAGAAVLFYLTTPPARLVASLQSHGVPARLTFVIYNGVAMIPRLADRAREVTAAQRARGLDTEGRIWRRARGVLAVAAPTVLSAVHDVESRTLALETRGFTRPGRPTPLWEPPQRAPERVLRWSILALLGLLLVAQDHGGLVAVLRLDGVSFRYPGVDHDSLHAVSLDLIPGTITGLAGPAEAGKSTLCMVASGLAPRVVGGTLVGTVSIDGVNVARWPMHQIGEQVVLGLQDPAGQLSLIAETVADEAAFGPANLGLPRSDVVSQAEAALELVGIRDLAKRDPRDLSGGQQQLVVIAGLLAMRPGHLVLDEPVAHLDARSTALVLAAIERIAASGAAVLIAEQRIDALESVCATLAVIAAGNIVSHGPIETVLGEPAVNAIGVDTTRGRLRRRLREVGLEHALLDSAS